MRREASPWHARAGAARSGVDVPSGLAVYLQHPMYLLRQGPLSDGSCGGAGRVEDISLCCEVDGVLFFICSARVLLMVSEPLM